MVVNFNLGKIRSITVAAVFTVVIGGIFILGRFLEPPEILRSERRLPVKLPPISAVTLASGEFMDKFNNYAADSFPFRDNFRTISAFLNFYVFWQADKQGLYMDAYGVGEFQRVDADSAGELTRKIKTVAESLGGVNLYCAYIPDKSIYSNKKLPGFDNALTGQLIYENLGKVGFSIIDMTDTLSGDSYYKTDLHWNQLMLESVADRLAASMGGTISLDQYTEEYAGEFEGVYSGQLALPTETDTLGYLSCPTLSAMYLNERTMELEPGPVYDRDKFYGLDPYDIFLSGAQPLVILENEAATSDKELYLFRDSFSSSLAPLLASCYSKVFLIDLRYIDMPRLSRIVEFKAGSDALFLYSTLVINNSNVLLVR